MSPGADFTAEELTLFLQEAEEQLQTLEEGLLRLERGTGDPELIQDIFRAAHTLKGSAATVGFQNMASLTHAMENILDLVRKNRLMPDSTMVSVLLEAVDVLRALKDSRDGEENGTPPLQGILSRLAAISLPALPPAGAMSAPGKNETVRIQVTLDHDCPMPAVRAYQVLMLLEEMGEIRQSVPSAADIEREQVGFHLMAEMATACSAAELQECLRQVPDIATVSVESNGQAPGGKQPREEGCDPPRPALRAPAARSIRIDVDLLDNMMNLVGELTIDRSRLARVVSRLSTGREADEDTQELTRTTLQIGKVTTRLQEEIMKARMLPVDNLFRKFPRMMRDLARQSGKELEFVVTGQDTELDRGVIDQISDPVIHLLRNALDHGIEPPAERLRLGKSRAGKIRLAAQHEENHIVITVSDDGKGIDPEKVRAHAVRKGLISEEAARHLSDREAIDLIFIPGFSTAERVTEVSGRGVGLDVVRQNLDRVNGSMEITTSPGQGTELRMKLPLTLAIISGLLVTVGAEIYVIPFGSVVEIVLLAPGEIHQVNGHDATLLRGKILPLLYLNDLFRLPREETPKPDKVLAVVVKASGVQLGIVVDGLVGEQEVVVKGLGKFLGNLHGISGATILGDGALALILDVPSLVRAYAAAPQPKRR